jgi:hypothetical protein
VRVKTLLLLLLTIGCSGPYARYRDAVRDDVDAAMVDASQMSARLNRTVLHNRIPFDSMDVVGRAVRDASGTVWKRAMHFADVTPPPDLAQAHADLGVQLMRLAAALEALGSGFKRCGDLAPHSSRGADQAATACQTHLTALVPHVGVVGEDLGGLRNRVQRALSSHGVLLKPMASP